MIILLTGLPGAGKTELAKLLKEKIPNTIIIRNDEIRKELFDVEGGKGYSEDQKILIDKTVMERTADAIAKNLTVILDRLSPTAEDRDLIKTLAESLGAKFVLIAVSSSESLVEQRINDRLSKDPLGVPFEVYLIWLKKYEQANDADHTVINNGNLDDLEKSADEIVWQLND